VVAAVEVLAEQDQRAGDGFSERTLLAKVPGGDQAAFEQLFLRYQAQVYGVVVAVLRDQTQAQEVTQEVFLQLWQQASRFDPTTLGSTATWVKHVARARAVDRVRLCESAGARDTRYTAASRAVDYDTVVERVLRRDEQASLRESLQRLAPLQRESIVLAYYAGLSTAEISERLNVNRSTIKTRIRDGLKSSPPIYRRLLRRSRNWWSPRRRTADSNSVRVRVQRPWWIPVQAQNTEHLLSSIGVGGTAGSLNRLAEEPNIPMKR